MPDFQQLRAFLDSNVLISASLNEGSDLLDLWRLRDVAPIISYYVIGEVERNIKSLDHGSRLSRLLACTQIVSDGDARLIPSHIRLVSKDQPILAAAIAASVDYLVTGDKRHFSNLYSTRVSGVYVINPADFLALHEDRLPE